jgi:V/A-type H+-transporting ATPase subunit B
MDRIFYKFADSFENRYIAQGETEDRPIEQTLDLGWELMAVLPRAELKRIREAFLEKYMKRFEKKSAQSASTASQAAVSKTATEDEG